MKIKKLVKWLLTDNQEIKFRQLFYRIRGLWYRGGLHYCPCCKTRILRFLPGGVITRFNAQCPRCGSLERHRLLWLYLQSKTDFFSSSLSVLDVAPSYFQQQQFKSQTNLNYISVDLTAPWVMMKIDLAFIPFPNDYFDCVICYHVLEHIPNDRQAMREIFRTLKPGGWAILQSPIDQTRTTTFEDPKAVTPKDRLRLFGQNDHFRIYGQDYSKRLEEVGFQVKIDSFVQNFPEDDINKYGILREEILFVCFKPHYHIP